ncbi:MAG: GNAT family N-acetyltransferase [Proteobacteria bacterium]|nr:GNAT family N-acetyltransferase [Pseudomonadota bacterium]
MAAIEVIIADKDELPAAQRFYECRGYGGSPIQAKDYVVLAKLQERIIGIGRLTQENGLLWLRGMQVDPQFQRAGVGTRILHLLSVEIGGRQCCCLPYTHLVAFYRQAGFVHAADLPSGLADRLADYVSRGLQVVAMVRPGQSRPNNSFKPTLLRKAA